MGEQRTKKISEEEALQEAEKTLKALKEKKETELKQEVKTSKDVKKKVEKKAKQRSVKYQQALQLVDRNKFYSLDEALDLVKKTSYSKFDGAVEMHLRLEKIKKGETIRGLLQLPHKAGKQLKVAILDEKLVEKIIQAKKTEYDILLATPEIMPKIARVAKILGPQGKMPNPKSGTVTANPKKIMKEIQAGRVEYKADSAGIIHLVIGKVSWDKAKLQENWQTVISALGGQKISSLVLSATMGPGIKVGL